MDKQIQQELLRGSFMRSPGRGMGVLIDINEIKSMKDAVKLSMADWEAGYLSPVRATPQSSRELSFFLLALAGFGAMVILLCMAG